MRIPDQSSGHYSSSGDHRKIGGHGVMNNRRRARSTEKGEREQSEERTNKESQNDEASTVALFIIESPKHQKTPRSLTDAFSDRAPGTRSPDKQTAPQNGSTDTQGPPRSGNKLQVTFQSSARFPEGHFSGHERLPSSLRGASMENRGLNDL
ncbi:hypothetical protein CRG98_030187 [Punica granatum]|uniref:Uncharacterized protein n=1 Tax=Punica granatum TaxID=22663 RepID=A0A2I0IZI5_PUNGR|nr:hypothetical protein CRG98_030187 [Punica granatum]